MRYTLEALGVKDYDHFIGWAFSEDPGTKHSNEVPQLWKHHDKCPIKPEDGIADSIKRMVSLYLLENSP